MAKIFENGKWKKRTLTALSAALAATLSLGVLAACGKTDDTQDDDDDTVVSATDTQLLKNGNFEFYGDKDIKETKERYNLINSPNNWTFTSGSPTSDTKSGIVNTADWEYMTAPGGSEFFKSFKKGGENAEFSTVVDEAAAHWTDDNVSAYDRLLFLDVYKDEIEDLDSNSEAAKTFAKTSYSIDFEDVEKLKEEVPSPTPCPDAADDETSVLMIHNSRVSDSVSGTAQYYTSSTTITLSAGTAAEVSVWVRTDNLTHYESTELEARGGAYIGVTNTVGGSTLDQMQIYNISTKGEWKQYTVYVRASTFATTTFRIVLGLGQGSTDDRLFAVNGYAFFDGLTCEVISDADYETAVKESGARTCTVDSLKEEKRFDTDTVTEDAFALDLYAGFDADNTLLGEDVEIGLTKQTSGSREYTSADVDASLGNAETNYTRIVKLAELASSGNSYAERVYQNDLKDKFPFGEDSPILMLLSGNGAAYTAKLPEITLEKGDRMLVSFFVKTSKIANGLTGASATVVDGENKTVISAFDTTTLAPVDIDSKSEDESKKDIYKGWTRCFFFLENDTDSSKTFHIELNYGPTTIVGTTKFGYGDGYAAFTNFETKTLTKNEYSYASTGDRAKKVSLTGVVEENKKFDSVSAADEKALEKGPANPVGFTGVLGGSRFVDQNGGDNTKPDGVYSGLLSSAYADNYAQSSEPWTDVLGKAEEGESGETWWQGLFGNARQPLVIVNKDAASYGYFATSTATVSASAYQRISMRVRASVGAKAYIYLFDVSSAKKSGQLIYPNMPGITYWYDDDGNICRIDPADKNFDKKSDILYELQDNGLYKKVGETGDSLYANLHNYEKDESGNLVTKEGEIAFFNNNGTFYAYREEGTGGYQYSRPVLPLPTDIARYDFTETELPGTSIVVDGTGDWVTVNFYLHTGNEAKEFRLEVWSGDRYGKAPNPANSYVFFDNYSSSSISNYETIRDEAVEEIKDGLNKASGKKLGDEGYLGTKDNLPQKDANGNPLSLYYTFTFFDSTSYVRYDKTTDEDESGNPWIAYKQSGYSEGLVYLSYTDDGMEDGEQMRTPSRSFFLDYSMTDVTVTPTEHTDSDDTDTDTDTETDGSIGANILLLVSSGILAVILVAVIIIVIVRRLLKNRSPKAKIKPAKDRRVKPAKAKKEPREEPKKEEPTDENDPYNK